MRSRIKTAFRLALVTLVVTGVIYPLAVTGLSAVLFPRLANGSVVTDSGGQVVGSRLLGQRFETAGYFHTRPSVSDYSGDVSGGSNLGPTNRELAAQVASRSAEVRMLEGLDTSAAVPVDLVTTSASGLDPHISPASALLQVKRVARERGIAPRAVFALVESHTEQPLLGIIGEARVNVLLLNLELDRVAAR